MHPPFTILIFLAFGTIGTLSSEPMGQTSGKECKVPNCRDCRSEYTCYLCDKDFIEQSGQCIQCLRGYYPSERGCALCPEGCADCKSDSNCSECLPGFIKEGTVCKKCENYIENCSECLPPIRDYVFNGDFENPPLEERGNDNPISNWHLFGEIDTDLVRYAPDGGEQSLDLPDGEQAYQVITELEPGESYTLSFYCTSDVSESREIQARALGGDLRTFTCSRFNGPWSFHSIVVIANTEIDQILFSVPDDSGDIFLDKVSLVKTSDLDRTCQVCTIGFYADMEKCTACSDSNCSVCSSSVCFECKEGFAFNYSRQCVSCSQLFAGCEECSSSFCKKCSSEYRISGGNCYITDKNCVESDWEYCKKCKEGFLLFNNFCYPKEKEKCENGYLNEFGKCIGCATGTYGFSEACYACPNQCEKCSEGNSCIQCAPGYEWKDGQCQVCELYIANCSSCSPAPENFISNGDFESPEYQHRGYGVPLDYWTPNLDPDHIRNPPNGGYQNIELLSDYPEANQEVNLETGELYTLSFYCLSGDSDLNKELQVSISGETTQMFTCPAFQSKKWVQYNMEFIGGTSTDTVRFSVANDSPIMLDDVVLARSSDLVPTCSGCLEGFYLFGNECLACSDTNCVSCPGDVCAECKGELFLDSEGTCKACGEIRENCEQCSGSSCTKCKYPYLEWNGYCYLVENNCILSTEGYCMNCLTGYFMMNKACYKLIEGCQWYNQFGYCTHCVSGNRPWNNYCF